MIALGEHAVDNGTEGIRIFQEAMKGARALSATTVVAMWRPEKDPIELETLERMVDALLCIRLRLHKPPLQRQLLYMMSYNLQFDLMTNRCTWLTLISQQIVRSPYGRLRWVV